MQHGSPVIGLVVTLVILAAIVIFAVIAKRKGYGLGPNTIVRCQRGHLFTTIWIPGGSFKAVRLGFARFQHCPVGNHWSIVTPVKEDELTTEERRFAAEHRDSRIP